MLATLPVDSEIRECQADLLGQDLFLRSEVAVNAF